MGSSDGGVVGLLVAIERPDLVSRLAIIGANFDNAGMVFDVDQVVAGMSPDGPEMAMLRETYSALSPDGADHWPVVFGKVSQSWTREPHISVDALRNIELPVLVIVGDDDMVSLGHTVELFEALPNAALAVVPFASHMVQMERSDVVNAFLVEFLRGAPAPTMMPIRRAGRDQPGP